MVEVGSGVAVGNFVRSLVRPAWLARWLAGLALAINRDAAVRAVNRFTPAEAKELGLKRCRNSGHEGRIAYFYEEGEFERDNKIYRRFRCPDCGHVAEQHARDKYARSLAAAPNHWVGRRR